MVNKPKIKIKLKKEHGGFYLFGLALLFLPFAALLSDFFIISFVTAFIGAIWCGVIEIQKYNALMDEVEEEIAKIARAKVVESGGRVPESIQVLDEKTEKTLKKFKRSQRRNSMTYFVFAALCFWMILQMLGLFS